MKISEVKISLFGNSEHLLLAHASFVLDSCFVVKDVKIVKSRRGVPIVSMPSKRVTDHCFECGTVNHLKAKFCNECGVRLDEWRNRCDCGDDPDCETCLGTGFLRSFHSDMAHPITSSFREEINKSILTGYDKEKRGESGDSWQERRAAW